MFGEEKRFGSKGPEKLPRVWVGEE